MPKQKSDREQYLIRIGETLVPVNREIYEAYYGGERRERYQAERDQAHGTLYFSAMGEEGADVLEILPASGENPLDTLERRERDLLLSAALHRLPGPDGTSCPGPGLPGGKGSAKGQSANGSSVSSNPCILTCRRPCRSQCSCPDENANNPPCLWKRPPKMKSISSFEEIPCRSIASTIFQRQ